MKLELKVKKWKEKDLGRSEVNWMFKGWDTLGIGREPSVGTDGRSSYQTTWMWAPGDPDLYLLAFLAPGR